MEEAGPQEQSDSGGGQHPQHQLRPEDDGPARRLRECPDTVAGDSRGRGDVPVLPASGQAEGGHSPQRGGHHLSPAGDQEHQLAVQAVNILSPLTAHSWSELCLDRIEMS